MATYILFALVLAAMLIVLGRATRTVAAAVGGDVEQRLWRDLLAGVACVRRITEAHTRVVEQRLRELRGEPPDHQ